MKTLVLAALIACGGTQRPAPRPAPPKTLQLNEPGAMVDVASRLPAGYVTVVDFWAESCGACHTVGGLLAIGVAKVPMILIRKVDVGDGLGDVSRAYGVNALPHYRIYDKHGRERHVLIGNDCTKASDLAKQLAAEP